MNRHDAVLLGGGDLKTLGDVLQHLPVGIRRYLVRRTQHIERVLLTVAKLEAGHLRRLVARLPRSRRGAGRGDHKQCAERNSCKNPHTSSTAIAVASPPPMQSAATPRLRLRRLSAWISVTRMRAPEAPMGWPSAQAPPFTFTFAWSRPRSRIAIIATLA